MLGRPLTRHRCLTKSARPLLVSSVSPVQNSFSSNWITDRFLGMAELLLDVELDDEQREYAENIFRSANALLTVINDILDFSKVESGRLDIEEVQFSMSVIGKYILQHATELI